MSRNYTIPANTRIGHVHLKVSNIDESLKFYEDLLGFEITERIGNSAVFLSAGGYHHHIALNTWHSAGASRASKSGVGLFHVAILYSTRIELALIVKRLFEKGYPLTGAADHGVSEAVYLDDPDGNGVELYWDKPREDWPLNESGEIRMVTNRLDLQELLSLV